MGFILESTLFKNTTPLKTSGVLCGPITIVYGLGGLVILLLDKYLLKKIKVNKVLKIIIAFFLFTAVLTLVEGISGYLGELIFDREMWNYTDKKYNIGKYMCLEMAPLWGIMGTILVFVLRPFFEINNKINTRRCYIFCYFNIFIRYCYNHNNKIKYYNLKSL